MNINEILSISDKIPSHLQQEIIGPHKIEADKKLRLVKPSTDGYIMILLGYRRSPIRDFESYLRFVIGFDEGDIELILKQYNSNFVTYEFFY